MSDQDTPTVSSTMSRDTITAPNVTTEQLNLSGLGMDGRVVQRITDDPSVSDPQTLPASTALNALAAEVRRKCTNLERTVTGYHYTSVISDPIVNPHFLDDLWQIPDTVVRDLGLATFVNRGITTNPQAVLTIPSGAFKVAGAYFVEVNVQTLPFGHIEVRDEENQLIKDIVAAGTTRFEIQCTYPDTKQLLLYIMDVPINYTVVLESVYVVWVRPTLDKYLQHAVVEVGTGGLGFATTAELTEALAELKTQITTHTNTEVADVTQIIQSHVNDSANPHHVTIGQIGAAPASHTHPPEACGASPLGHTHTPDQCGAAPTIHGHTPEDCGAAPLGHSHTLAALGAAPVVHGHTPIDCGAAAAQHTHTPDQCGASPHDHTHTLAALNAAAAQHNHTLTEITDAYVITQNIAASEARSAALITAANQATTNTTTALSAHTQNKNNPHSVTCEQIGASKTGHVHSPAECNSAPAVHTHTLSQITDIVTINNSIAETASALRGADFLITTNLNNHTSDRNNPHGVTKSQVGLGQVADYPMATEAEARNGTLAARYMSPIATKTALAEMLQTPEMDAAKLIPTPIYNVVLDQTPLMLPLQKDRVYQISIEHLGNGRLKDLVLAFNGIPSGLTHYNNNCVGRTINANDLGWYSQNENGFRLFNPNIGPNAGCGLLTLNTKDFSLIGQLEGRYLNDAGQETAAASVPVLFSGSLQLASLTTLRNATSLNLYLYSSSGIPTYSTIRIYELVPIQKDPTMVIDATPIGTITTFCGNSAPVGWAKLDGSELARASYPELWQHAQNQGIVLGEATWQAQVASLGQCDRFSSGNGINTFRLPKMTAALFSQASSPIIKIQLAQVPDSQGILYRFIWNN